MKTTFFFKLMDAQGWQIKAGYDGKATHLYAVLIDADRDEYGVVGADGYVFESIFLSCRGDGSYVVPAQRVPDVAKTAWEAVNEKTTQ